MSSDTEEHLGRELPTQTDAEFLASHEQGDESGEEEEPTDPSTTTNSGLPNNLLQSPLRSAPNEGGLEWQCLMPKLKIKRCAGNHRQSKCS